MPYLMLSLLAALLMPLHTRLARSEPAAGAVVATAPRELRLWFEGGVEAEFMQVGLCSASGAQLALGAPRAGADDGLVVVPVPLALAAGRYTVTWATVGRDGHPVSGDYAFTIAGATASGPVATAVVDTAYLDSAAWGAGALGLTPGQSAPVGAVTGRSTSSPAQYSALMRPVRWVELSATVLALGAVAMLLLVLRTARGNVAHERFIGAATRRTHTLGLAAVGAYIVATGARFALESRSLHGGDGGLSPRELAQAAGTGWGRAWVIATMAMIVVGIALWTRRVAKCPAAESGPARRTARRGTDLALAAAALVAALGPAMTGHAAGTAAMMPVAVLADWLHVVGASAWVGGVGCMALAAAPAALAQPAGSRAPSMAWLISAFHALATPAIALVVLSGLVSAWLRVGSWGALMSSNYGDLLLFKVYLAAFTALFGVYHWKRVHPRLVAAGADDDRAARHMGWTLRVELLVGILVVAITAALVSVQPPR